MAEFINTIDVLGDDAVIDTIIDRTIAEFKDDTIIKVGDHAFDKCVALTTVDCPNALSIGNKCFDSCTNLSSINFPSVTSLGQNAFYQCDLQKVCFPSLQDLFMYYHFGGNKSLSYAEFSVLKNVGGHMFNGCSSLTALVLRNSTLCGLVATDAFNNTPIKSGTGYIYVPKALVDSYKSATNWSTYAAQFRALEDYTVDGTITGALDETKI